MKIFSEKTHNLLRKAQLIIFALATAWGIVTASLDLGTVGAIISAVTGAAGAFVTYLVENDSAKYFETKTIVGKITPDKAEG